MTEMVCSGWRGLLRLVRGDISWSHALLRSWMTICRLGRRREYGKLYFQNVYEAQDPWDYETSPYEQRKYRTLLNDLSAGSYKKALEVGCSIGVFTRLLASRVEALDGIDISSRAVIAARRRCRDLKHVRLFVSDFFSHPGKAIYDLVLCSEILYFFWEPRWLRQSAREAAIRLLAKGGTLVVVWGGFRLVQDWDSCLSESGKLRLRRTRLVNDPVRPYRISIFERL